MLPVMAEPFDTFSPENRDLSKDFSPKPNLKFSLLGFGAGLLWLSCRIGELVEIQYFCLLSLPFLLFYNGQRGKRNMKNFFYWFYPLHLVIIGAVGFIIDML